MPGGWVPFDQGPEAGPSRWPRAQCRCHGSPGSGGLQRARRTWWSCLVSRTTLRRSADKVLTAVGCGSRSFHPKATSLEPRVAPLPHLKRLIPPGRERHLPRLPGRLKLHNKPGEVVRCVSVEPEAKDLGSYLRDALPVGRGVALCHARYDTRRRAGSQRERASTLALGHCEATRVRRPARWPGVLRGAGLARPAAPDD